jgi:hypothetical protein
MTDIEQQLRDRLLAAPPKFDPVPLAAVAERIQRRRQLAGAAGLVAVVLLSGAAILVPRLAVGGGDTSNSAAVAGAASRPDTAIPQAGGKQPAPSVTAPDATASPGQPPAGLGCPPRMSGNSIVDYVDFVRFGGREYIAGRTGTAQKVPRASLGRRLGTVRCDLSAVRPDPYYHPVDGDAGYLPAGTPLYEIRGTPTGKRIAALVGKDWVVYEVYPER